MSNRELVAQIESIMKIQKKDQKLFNNDKIEDIYFELIQEEKNRIDIGLKNSLEIFILTVLIKFKLFFINYKDSYKFIGKDQIH